MINRSTTRVIPHFPVALDEVAFLFGTLVAETILASVHVRARKQAGHMDASDLIKALQTSCEEGVVHIWKITYREKFSGCNFSNNRIGVCSRTL